MPPTTIVGVISDTHGLLRPEALDALDGSDLILHAGDIGTSSVLEMLAEVAPVVAVRGNVDRGEWAKSIPEKTAVEIGDATVYILHDRQMLDLKPDAAGFQAVVSGHSHQVVQEMKDGVLYFNPGSAGPKRFHLPVTLGRFVVTGATIEHEIITLDV
jgi:putative phosphoesterase